MKKILIIFTSFIALLAVSAFAVPFFFKDKIQAKVDQEIQKKINATVLYKDFDLSVFKNFPELTLSLSEFGIVGKRPFMADTLIQAEEFSVSVDVKSILSSSKIEVHSINLISPKILIKTLRDGSSNYDIYRKDSLQVQQEEANAKSSFKANIQSWKITDGQIIYNNKRNNAYVSLQNVTHEGSGNVASDVYDLTTKTDIGNANIDYDGINYLTDKKLSAAMKMTIDQINNKYTFIDNALTINDFILKFAGFITKPNVTNTILDLTYSSPENSFKNLLSLVPNIYTDKFKDLKAEGKIKFDGMLKGTKNASSFPTFDFNLVVSDAMFQYPDLPTAVTGINIDFKAKNTTNNLDNSILDFKKLVLKFGKNPVNGRVLIEGLKKSKVDADLMAKLDLQQLSQIFPMKGLEMRGLYDLNLKAKGTYDSLTKQFPQVNAVMNLANGFIKSDKFPEPIQNINAQATLLNTDGTLASTKLDISDLKMILGGEPFTAKGTVQNFENYHWDIKAKGKIDLTKITKIYPLKDMTFNGIIDADIETKGMMSDVKAKRYANLPTKGKATVKDMEFASKDYPQGIKVTDADMTFTPQSINVSNSKGYLGTSDFVANGTFSNYMGYVLNNESLKGKMKLKSQKFKVNEWITQAPEASVAQPPKGELKSEYRIVAKVPPSGAEEAISIPKNINLIIDSEIAEVLYDKMKMNNVKGLLTLGNGAVRMENVGFQSLGGNFITNGTYNSADLAHPKFDFALNLENVEIAQAYQHLSIVKYLMPIAQYLIGGASSKFKIDGELGQDMMPKFNTLNGDGIMKILNGEVSKDNPLVQKLVEITKLIKLKDTKLDNLLMQFEIKDGTFGVKPFDIKFDDYKITASGRHGLTGSMDYTVVLDVPAGKTGEAFSNIFQKWTGKALQGTDRIKFDLALGGTVKSPIFGFKGSSTANSIKDAVLAEAKSQVNAVKIKALEEADRLKKEAEIRIQAEKDKLMSQAKATVDSIKKVANERAKSILEQQKKNVLDGLFKKKPIQVDSTNKNLRKN